MTLNGVIAVILRYFTEFDSLGGLFTVVKDRPIRFGAEYPLPVIFWPKLIHAAVVRSPYDS